MVYYYYIASYTQATPSFSMLHVSACNIERSGEGLGTRLIIIYNRLYTLKVDITAFEIEEFFFFFLVDHVYSSSHRDKLFPALGFGGKIDGKVYNTLGYSF